MEINVSPCNSSNLFLKYLKFPFHVHVSIFFFLLIPSVNPLSFNFSSSNRTTRDIINLERDATFSDQGTIELTEFSSASGSTQYSSGRASYKDPVRLWDNKTGILTDFTTHFSFTLNRMNGSRTIADGLALFLAPNGSTIPHDSGGGALGLFSNDLALNKTKNRIIAVEFDTWGNDWDPVPYNHTSEGPRNPSFEDPPYHVGIDVNSIDSVKTATWTNSIEYGKTTSTWISYNSSTKNLSVSWTYGDNSSSSLSYRIDLRQYLPEWITIGLSGSTGLSGLRHQIYSWEFNSSLEVEESNPATTSNVRKAMMVGIVVGTSFLMGAMGFLCFVLWTKMKRERMEKEDDSTLDDFMNDEFEKGTGPKRFLCGELARATNDFREEQKLGEGGFGGVYKGFLTDLNMDVAVKKVSQRSKQGIKEYMSEVKIISQLRHKNLVQLIGWCHQRKEFLLVYEFMSNGSLDKYLFGQKGLLVWEIRYKIALELASALFYLHEEWKQCVVHRDIKPSNVMLDSNFNAKLGDFGLARLIEHDQGPQTTVLAGTLGYMAPECVITGRSSKESDVYSYGIVVLEIACCRRSAEIVLEGSKIRLVEWVWELYGKGCLLEAVDWRLMNTGFDVKQMECLMAVGLWCAHPDSNLRPSIKKAMQVLSFEAPLPILPSKMPVPTYHNPVTNARSPSIDAFSVATVASTSSILYPR
ncbi:PREDICTED: L-type lectin-domain containing receptor kinase IX.1-like [Nelumbo nucifera]|uniref:non-specific serine/threonine protein kinase n=2 Tax=Nelumbo nucifera TaxID=4432 RepID=A0A822ZPY8_NELNU|nr:PREDICTED: L-type lectin-domain containing receptor kinase IX.1-like [Nelumbo nucifera]DAD45419.1 TPA_asm: hypothetical protein HUJ06_003649 [Nelumbo nucifera]